LIISGPLILTLTAPRSRKVVSSSVNRLCRFQASMGMAVAVAVAIIY